MFGESVDAATIHVSSPIEPAYYDQPFVMIGGEVFEIVEAGIWARDADGTLIEVRPMTVKRGTFKSE